MLCREHSAKEKQVVKCNSSINKTYSVSLPSHSWSSVMHIVQHTVVSCEVYLVWG